MGERDPRSGSGREAFRPTEQLTGWVCVALAVAVVALYVVEHDRGMPLWLVPAAVTFAALSWAVLLRPRVALVEESLELRGSFGTVWVPLAQIEKVAVGRVLAVSTEDRRWTSAALGRSRRQARRDDVAAASGSGPARHTSLSYAAIVEQRLRAALLDARRPRGGASRPATTDASASGGVVRRPAWPEIVLVGVSASATLVVSILA